MSNRVVRHYVQQEGLLAGRDFLRVSFGDEHGGHLFDRETEPNGKWWARMRKVLLEGKLTVYLLIYTLCVGWMDS
jgi:hypothetical protein